MPLKPPNEPEFLKLLQTQSISFAPVTLELVRTQDVESQQSNSGRWRLDGVVRVTWKNRWALYGLGYKPSASPRTLETSLLRAQQTTGAGLLPLIVLPFLSEEALQQLNEREVSGFDLCGNGLLIAPDFSVWSAGHANKFKETKTIRNPFAGDSSIFARCFLLHPKFESLSELQRFARERMESATASSFQRAGLALGTASKVTRALIEELVVAKDGQNLRLMSVERLLSLLRREGRSRGHGRGRDAVSTLSGKTPLKEAEVWARLSKARRSGVLRAVATGVASSGRYGVLSGVETLSLYVDNLQAVSELLQIRETGAFANIHLHQDHKNVVYFDARPQGDALWASPIQSWLELTQGGPREQEAAGGIERLLISGRANLLS